MFNFPFLPVEGLHEFNLDWFLKRFHELSEEWDETKAAWIALKEWVENYFEDTDFVKKIHDALDEMFEDGRLNEIMYQIIGNTALPVFVDSMSEMTNHNKVYVLKSTGMIYFWDGETWVATGLTYPDAKSTVTSSNIVLTADNMHGYTSADEFTNNQIYAFSAGAWRLLSDMPLYSMPQDGVIITYVNSVTTNQPAKTQILITPNHAYTRFKWGPSQWGKWQYLKGGMLITPTSEEGVTDADSVANNTTYMIQANVTEERVRNLPRYGLNGVLTSYGYGGTVTDDNAGVLQTFTTERFTYYRLKWAGIWGQWHKSTTNDYIQSHGQATFSDSTTIQPNSISLIMGNITSEDITGLPRYGLDGWLLTFSYLDTPDTNNFIQIFVTGWNIYFRFKINNTTYPWRVWGFQTNNLVFVQSTVMTNYPDYQNANTLPLMSYVLFSVTPEQVTNLPLYYSPICVMTWGNRNESADGRFQVAYSLQYGEMFYRMSWGSTWGEWQAWNNNTGYNMATVISPRAKISSYNYDINRLKVASLGDSITTAEGGGGSRYFISELSRYLQRYFNLTNPPYNRNYGVGGATIHRNETTNNDLYTQVQRFINDEWSTDCTHLFIICGTNDAVNHYDLLECKNELITCLQLLHTYNPDLNIIYISPIHRHSGGQGELQKYAKLFYNTVLYLSSAGAGVLPVVTERMSVVNGFEIPLTMHTYNASNTLPQSYNINGLNAMTPDGVHPYGWARTVMANYICQQIV